MQYQSFMTHQESAATERGLPEAAIPWNAIEREAVVDEEELFYLITTASFVKTASRIEAVKLTDYFSNDSEVSGWLNLCWQQEEIQHGQFLKDYIKSTWPQFDWDSAYQFFFTEYAPERMTVPLEGLRSLELASRYLNEMCAAGYYDALSHLRQDHVLSALVKGIRGDELRQSRYFYRYYIRYREIENTHRPQLLRTLLHRLKTYDGDASLLALKHVYGACHPGDPFDMSIYLSMQKRCRDMFMCYFPNKMNTRALIKPLELGTVTRAIALPIARVLVRRVMA